MLKDKELLIKEIRNKIEAFLGNDIINADCTLSEFVKQDGKINRLYVNVNAVDKKRRYKKGSLGYFDLNKTEFIKEGCFWSAGVRDILQEICMNFKIEVLEKSEEQIEKNRILKNMQLRKNKIDQEKTKLVREMKESKEKYIQKIVEENNIDLKKDPFGFLRFKKTIKSQEYLKLEEQYKLLNEEFIEIEEKIKNY